ncbi:MAG: hypothetical protein ACXWKH_11110 [Limisphaerales bacterium]
MKHAFYIALFTLTITIVISFCSCAGKYGQLSTNGQSITYTPPTGTFGK